METSLSNSARFQFTGFQIYSLSRMAIFFFFRILKKNISLACFRYAERIQPWLHYVPIQVDFDDLQDALLFFRGDGNGEGSHENLARKIALAGREWSRAIWRVEDVAAYLFRLVYFYFILVYFRYGYRLTLEYARLMSTDREAMSYNDETNW